MTLMSALEQAFCRSAPWEAFARRVVLPRVDGDHAWAGTVLEVGGGAGAMAEGLLLRQPAIERLVLVDVDPTMTAAARKRLAAYGDRADVVDSDGTGLPVADASADTVCSWLMLHHALPWQPLLADAKRVLRPGGWLLGYDLTDAPVGRLLHGVSRSEHQLISPSEIADELEAQGWSNIRIRPTGVGQVMTFRAQRPEG